MLGLRVQSAWAKMAKRSVNSLTVNVYPQGATAAPSSAAQDLCPMKCAGTPLKRPLLHTYTLNENSLKKKKTHEKSHSGKKVPHCLVLNGELWNFNMTTPSPWNMASVFL